MRQNSSMLTGTSITYTTISSNGGTPQIDGDGLPSISSSGLVTPQIIMPEGLFKLTFLPPTLTANRAMNYGDGANSSVVSTSLTTTSAGSPYTVPLQGCTSSSHVWIQGTNAAAELDRAAGNVYPGTVSANQVIVNTGVTSGETFNIFATIN